MDSQVGRVLDALKRVVWRTIPLSSVGRTTAITWAKRKLPEEYFGDPTTRVPLMFADRVFPKVPVVGVLPSCWIFTQLWLICVD